MVGRYQRSVKPCWYRHPLAVDQLAACYLAWSAAYLEDALPTAPAEWHDRWFPHLMRLVDADTKACTARKHDEGEELAPSVHEREHFEAFIEANVKLPSGAEPRDGVLTGFARPLDCSQSTRRLRGLAAQAIRSALNR